MLISASVTVYALSGATQIASTATVLFLQPWFLVLVAASAVERLTGLATGVAFERDWVVLVSIRCSLRCFLVVFVVMMDGM
jgi:hypothetical protein